MSINYLTSISLILNDLKVYIIILMNLILLSDDVKIASPCECVQMELGLHLGPREYSTIAPSRWSPM